MQLLPSLHLPSLKLLTFILIPVNTLISTQSGCRLSKTLQFVPNEMFVIVTIIFQGVVDGSDEGCKFN